MTSEYNRSGWRPMPTRVALAFLWIGLACVAWRLKDSFKPASDEHIAIAMAIAGCFIVPPLIAIGTLLGPVRLSALIGLACFAAIAIWVVFEMARFGV